MDMILILFLVGVFGAASSVFVIPCWRWMIHVCTTLCTIKMRPRYRFLGSGIIDLLVDPR